MKLPTDLVLHTGVAISQILFCIDNGIIRNISADVELNCAISESALKAWPHKLWAPHVNRIDNINHCLRSFGVDGCSTNMMQKQQGLKPSKESMLRSSLKSFVMLGDGPVGHIAIPEFRSRLQYLNKRALTDCNLMEELVWAQYYSPERARNGILLDSSAGSETKWLIQKITELSGTGHRVRLIVLDPCGRNLTVP